MAKALFLAWASPVDEAADGEFNAWYEGTHVPQVRASIPAITAVHRYTTADLPDGGGVGAQPAHRYLTVYELDTDDVPAAAAALAAAAAAGKLDMTAAMDFTGHPPVMQWYRGLPA